MNNLSNAVAENMCNFERRLQAEEQYRQAQVDLERAQDALQQTELEERILQIERDLC